MNGIEGNLALAEGSAAPLVRERRWERLDGKPVLMAPPAANHHFICQNIYRIFANFLTGKPCRAIMDGMMVYLSEKDHFIPDMMVVCDRDKITRNGIYGAPDLVVEVLSHSTRKRDLGYKKAVYERAGVREYWIVHPEGQALEQYLLRDGTFFLAEAPGMYDEEDLEMDMLLPEERADMKMSFSCGIFPDLEISLDDIFYDLI